MIAQKNDNLNPKPKEIKIGSLVRIKTYNLLEEITEFTKGVNNYGGYHSPSSTWGLSQTKVGWTVPGTLGTGNTLKKYITTPARTHKIKASEKQVQVPAPESMSITEVQCDTYDTINLEGSRDFGGIDSLDIGNDIPVGPGTKASRQNQTTGNFDDFTIESWTSSDTCEENFTNTQPLAEEPVYVQSPLWIDQMINTQPIGQQIINNNFSLDLGEQSILGYNSVDDFFNSSFTRFETPKKHEPTGIIIDRFDPVVTTQNGERVTINSNLFDTKLVKVLVGENKCLWVKETDVSIMEMKDRKRKNG